MSWVRPVAHHDPVRRRRPYALERRAENARVRLQVPVIRRRHRRGDERLEVEVGLERLQTAVGVGDQADAVAGGVNRRERRLDVVVEREVAAGSPLVVDLLRARLDPGPRGAHLDQDASRVAQERLRPVGVVLPRVELDRRLAHRIREAQRINPQPVARGEGPIALAVENGSGVDQCEVRRRRRPLSCVAGGRIRDGRNPARPASRRTMDPIIFTLQLRVEWPSGRHLRPPRAPPRHARLERDAEPPADRLSHEGRPTGHRTRRHRALGTDGPVRPDSGAAPRRAALHPARRTALRQRRDPRRHGSQQDPEGLRRPGADHGGVRRAVRAGLGLPRPADRAPRRSPAQGTAAGDGRGRRAPRVPPVRGAVRRDSARRLQAARRPRRLGPTRT